jgi:hypothetical protein
MKFNTATILVISASSASVFTPTDGATQNRAAKAHHGRNVAAKNVQGQNSMMQNNLEQFLVERQEEHRKNDIKEFVKERRATRTQMLKNNGNNHQRAVQKECDPTTADLGVLGCGQHQYCLESSTSTLGGICHSSLEVPETVPDQKKNPKGLRQLADPSTIPPTSSPSSSGTYKQIDFDEEYLLGQLAYSCVETEYEWNFCDCSGFDFDQGVGTISCEQRNDCTDDSQNSLCYSWTYELEIFSSTDIVSKSCDIFSKGGDATSFCYISAFSSIPDYFYGRSSDQTMEFDGAECVVTTKTEEVTEPSCRYNDEGLPFIEDYTWSSSCREIDCTNTNLGQVISECDGEYMFSVVLESLL